MTSGTTVRVEEIYSLSSVVLTYFDKLYRELYVTNTCHKAPPIRAHTLTRTDRTPFPSMACSYTKLRCSESSVHFHWARPSPEERIVLLGEYWNRQPTSVVTAPSRGWNKAGRRFPIKIAPLFPPPSLRLWDIVNGQLTGNLLFYGSLTTPGYFHISRTVTCRESAKKLNCKLLGFYVHHINEMTVLNHPYAHS